MKPVRSATSHLTARYGALHGCYWSVYCCLFSFAAPFLLAKGYTATQAGVMLALSCLLSCLLQPFFASVTDRSEKISLRVMMIGTLSVSFTCLVLLRFLVLPAVVYAIVYLTGALLMDLTLPLINALSVYYTSRGMPINFGLGRGVGSISYAAASMLFGFIMERGGPDAMLLTAITIYALLLLLVVSFPRILAARQNAAQANPGADAPTAPSGRLMEPPCTLPQFFHRYRWFCVSLFGILFMAAFHAMSENYLILILKRVGGDNAHLGIALAIATAAETPVILFFSRYRKRASTGTWILIAALSFLLKSFFFVLSKSVLAIMLNQLLQICSYGLYIPASVLYARERIRVADMVKGQAMITSFYALGCSLGNFTGGRLIDRFGVDAMLFCGIGFAATAVLILFLSINRQKPIAADTP